MKKFNVSPNGGLMEMFADDFMEEACHMDSKALLHECVAANLLNAQCLEEVMSSVELGVVTRGDVIDCLGFEEEPLEYQEFAEATDLFADDLDERVDHSMNRIRMISRRERQAFQHSGIGILFGGQRY